MSYASCWLVAKMLSHPQTQPGVLRGHKATNSPCPKYVKPLQGLSTRKSNDCQKKKTYTRWKLYISNHISRQALHINTSETATKKVHLTTNLKTIPLFDLVGILTSRGFGAERRKCQRPRRPSAAWRSIRAPECFLITPATPSGNDSLLFHSLKLPTHDLLF